MAQATRGDAVANTPWASSCGEGAEAVGWSWDALGACHEPSLEI